MAEIVGRKPIELKLSDQLNGYIPVYNSSSRLWGTISKNDFITGSAFTSGSNIFIGDQTVSGSLTVLQGITGSLFGTASYASNAWAIGGNNFTGGDSNRILGTLSDHDLSIYTSGSRVATFTKSGSFILSLFPPNSISNEKVLIEGGYTSLYNLIKATSYIDSYSQFNIQNLFSGSNSSSDIVATADNGTELMNYIDMGINSITFTGSVGDANDAYLYSTGNDLHIGNASNYPVQFFAGGIDNNANRKFQLNPNNSHQMTGSLDVSGSIVAQSFTGSLQGSSSYALTASYADNFTVGGTLTAQTIVAQTITSSIEFITGSTRNGSLLTNTHEFTGSVNITGSLEVNGRNYINDSSSFESRITTNSSSLALFSGSYINESSSFDLRIATNSSSFALFSGSYVNESSSFDLRITTNSSSFANFSGSYVNESSSFASRITTNSSSFVNFSGSYVNESASFTDRIRVNSSSFTDFSGSYINESASFASRITNNSASISTLSTNFNSFSGSFMTGSFTGSFVGSLTGTASYAENAPNYLPLAGGTMTGDIYAAGRSFTFQDLLLGAGTTFGKLTTDGSKYISVMPTYNVESARFWSNGNVTIQDAGTYVDNGFRLDVSGSGRFTDGLTVTGSLQATNGITGSLLGTASQALTASSADDFTVRGTLTAQTLVAQTITSSIEFITGSTRNGSLLTNTHQFTGSVNITGSLTLNNSNVILTNQTSSMSVATASFVSLAQTASYVLQAVSASFSSTASSVNQLNQNVVISGSLTVSGSTNIIGNSGTTLLSSNADTLVFTGSFYASGSLEVNGRNYINDSSSFASRIATNSSSFANFSGSYINESASLASRITTNSSSFTSFSGSYVNESASFASRIATNSSSFTSFSGSYVNESASFTDRITNNSASISSLSASFDSFSGSYNTGSFTGSFIGRVTGSFSGSLYNLQNDVLGHIPFFSSSQVLADSIIRQLDNGSGSYSIVINQDNITTAAPEALYVYQPSATSYNVIAGKGNLNNYLQLNIQNTNTGENASSDVVATANNGNETSNYIDMGINSEGFTGSIGDANDAYLYSTGRHLHIGTATNFPIQFFAGGVDHDANRKFQLNPNNSHELTGSLSITEKLNVIGGVTASLQGTASWANNAIIALSASYWSGSIINAATASYVLNAVSSSYATSALTASNAISASYAATASSADNFTIRGTLTAQTIVSQTITSSIEFITGSTRNGSTTANTHEFTGSVLVSGSLIVNDSDVILSNQTSSMSVLSASYASTASYIETAQTASYVLQAQSASYWSGSIINAATASYVETAQTASYVLNAVNAVSASYALTSSYLNPIENSYLVLSQVSQSLNFQDDTEAAAGGVPLGGLYRNGNFILIRIV